MAFAVIELQKKQTNQLKSAPVGYSWTNLIFGFFVPFIRGDWKLGLIFLAIGIITWGFGSIVTSFFFNKLYTNNLLSDGFKITNLNGADPTLVKSSLGLIKI